MNEIYPKTPRYSGVTASKAAHDRVSVVIPAYGYCPNLLDVVSAVLAQSRPPEEIIVVHSGSDDPSGSLGQLDERLHVIHVDERMFAGAARNIGARHATGEWLVFLDSDVLPAGDWLEILSFEAESTPTAFFVGSLGYQETGGYWGMCVWTIEFSSVHPYLRKREISGGASANMIVSRRDFDAVGGFPGTFRAGQDVYFTAALRDRGLRSVFVPDAEVRHVNIPGLGHCLSHLHMVGRWSALARCVRAGGRRMVLPYLLFAPVAWLVRFGLIYYRALRWGAGFRLRALCLAPGILLGVLAWNLGFLTAFCKELPDSEA